MLKKLRIRLADPGIPDSYVCEILENSLDNENEHMALESITLENALHPIEDIKLKNYFEVLMSNECRKNLRTHSVDENKKILQEKMIVRKNDNKEKIQVKKIDSHCKQLRQNDSSDDETLFQMKKKFKLINGLSKSENINHNKILNEIKIVEEGERIFDSPKLTRNEFIFKKNQNSSILSYFSSTENSDEVQNIELNQSNKIIELKQCKEKELECINIDNENSSFKTNKENVKLAPLFIKKEKKVIDPEIQKARFNFLHKRPPPLKNFKNVKNVEFFEDFSTAILHVQQRDDNIYWSKRKILLPSNVAPHMEIDYEKIQNKTFRLNILKNNRTSDAKIDGNKNISDTVGISEGALGKLKLKYKNLNLDVVIDNLKKKKDKFTQLSCGLKISKSINEKSHSDKTTKNDLGLEVFNSLWIDKYKPTSNEILGNENTVKKLKTWLKSWKVFDEELKSFNNSEKEKEEENNDSESDYFVDSDEKSHKLKAPCNVCILSGPNGCGKTALVFALAEELDFNIVEMNSSCKRSGKNVLAYFQEATQSHKVRRVALSVVESNQQNKKKKRNEKTIKTPINPKIVEEGKDSKISLLLIEDADVVFEEKDDGFYPAISSLIQTSKRPFIFISNDPNFTFIDNLKTEESLVLKMKYPHFYKSCALLDVVSTLEEKPTNRKVIEFIVQQNDFDLRKSLLDLQTWSGCSREKIIFNRPLTLGDFWWGSFNFLHRKNLKHFSKNGRSKRKRSNKHLYDSDDSNDEEDIEVEVKKFKQTFENKSCFTFNSEVAQTNPNLGLYFQILDIMSTVDVIDPLNGVGPIPNLSYVVKDSLSLEEKAVDIDMTQEEMKKNLIEDLEELSTRLFVDECQIMENDEIKIEIDFPSLEEIRWQKIQENARNELSSLLPLTTDSRSAHLDYLPILRNICRAEKNRSIINSKRKNRFNHYFNNSLKLSEKNLEISQQVFSC